MTTKTDYEVVIGLETHVQLKTRSKMFCSCERDYFDTEPNTHACPVCLAMPGMLPVINAQAVSFTILTGLALGCEIPLHSKFDRKNYPYPDLLKGYQISQFDQPLCLGGGLEIEVDGVTSFVHLERIHLEEDTARLLHRDGGGGEAYSLLDVNRAGVPLMEVVTQPDMHSSAEALTYLRKLRQLLRYLGVSDADMEKGSFRCDANISLRPRGQQELGAKVEVKNMNSFRAIQRALETEIVRQSAMLDAGETIAQETRGYIDATGDTVSQRSKEQAHDYRYFPEPDLPPLLTEPAVVDELRAQLPELPEARRERFEQQYGLGAEEARVLTETRARADSFEEAVGHSTPDRAKAVARWLIGDVAALPDDGVHARELAELRDEIAELREIKIGEEKPDRDSRSLPDAHDPSHQIDSARALLRQFEAADVSKQIEAARDAFKLLSARDSTKQMDAARKVVRQLSASDFVGQMEAVRKAFRQIDMRSLLKQMDMTRNALRRLDLHDVNKLIKESEKAVKQLRSFREDAAKLHNIPDRLAEMAAAQKVPARHVAELVDLVEDGAITAASAKQVLRLAFESGEMPSAIVEARGLGRVDDGDALDGVAAAVIEANPKAVEDYRGGKESAIKFLVGQVMRETRGTSDPNSAAETLRRLLDAG